jgi:hypothetical protein
MAVKAQLNIQLYADSVLIAESDDHELWRRVFAAIQTGKAFAGDDDDVKTPAATIPRRSPNQTGPIAAFASELGVSEDEVVGACGPTTQAPYIHLDQRYWEALRNKTGSRGIDAISPVALAATLLALWFKHGQIDGVLTVQHCQATLATINLRDQNAARSLRNAEWIQTRNSAVVINPAQWSQAVRIARAYCQKKSPKELQTASEE